jgi:hypothetical protein
MWLLLLFTCPPIAWYLVNINTSYRKLGRWLKRNLLITKGKPFTCEFCTGFWLTFGVYFAYAENWIYLLLTAISSGVFTFMITLRYNGR